MNLIFMGTPEFAVSPLMALHTTGHNIKAVYTQPPRPAGRGQKELPSPVQQKAEALGIPVHYPTSLKDEAVQQELRDYGADVIVVVAYGLLLPQAVLDITPHGCLNIHASLLPRWRGAAPIQNAILEGDKETGITIMQMDKGLDSGPMLHTVRCSIHDDDTSSSLHNRLAIMGAEAIVEALEQLEAGKLEPEIQDASQVTYAHKINKRDAEIDWRQDAVAIERLIRAYKPWPLAYTHFKGEVLKIHKAHVVQTASDAAPGTVIEAGAHLVIACGSAALELEVLQRPSKAPMDAASLLRGYVMEKGEVLGK